MIWWPFRRRRIPTKAERQRARMRLEAAKGIATDRYGDGKATGRLLLAIHRALTEIHYPARG